MTGLFGMRHVGPGLIDYGSGLAAERFGGDFAESRKGSGAWGGSGLPPRLVLWYEGEVARPICPAVVCAASGGIASDKRM
jgi:hypothetical protein